MGTRSAHKQSLNTPCRGPILPIICHSVYILFIHSALTTLDAGCAYPEADKIHITRLAYMISNVQLPSRNSVENLTLPDMTASESVSARQASSRCTYLAIASACFLFPSPIP